MFHLGTMTFNANISFLFNLSKRFTFVQYVFFLSKYISYISTVPKSWHRLSLFTAISVIKNHIIKRYS
jgi:hypothetical protein